jgi:hypothetical protein
MPLAQPISDRSDLPHRQSVWFLTQRKLETKSELLLGSSEERQLLALLDVHDQKVIQLDILSSEVDDSQLLDFVLQALRPPSDVISEGSLPKQLWVEEPCLVKLLSPSLAEMQISVLHKIPPAVLTDLVDNLQDTLSLTPLEFPGLLSIPTITSQRILALCESAAQFYRNKPWQFFANDQTLCVHINPPGKSYYVQVMGQAGIEFGIVIFQSWHDLEQFYQVSEDPLSHIPVSGWFSLTFVNKDLLPDQDRITFERLGCEIVNPESYPLPLVYTPETIRRPTPDEIRLLEIIMPVIVEFVTSRLNQDDQGVFLATTFHSSLKSFEEEYAVTISFPAIES